MSTFSIPWVNDGEPFEVTPDKLTLGDVEKAQIARKHVLENLGYGLDDVPEEFHDLYRREVVEEMGLAQDRTLIHRFLCRVDPSLEDESAEAIADKLDTETLNRLNQALSEAREDADADEEALEDPSG